MSHFPIYVFLDRIRSLYNVGAFFRTCDAVRVKKIFVSQYTPRPPRKEITKTALGAEHSVDYEYVEDSVKTLKKLKEQKVQIVLVETGKDTIPYIDFQPAFPVCLIFGNEITGISSELLPFADAKISIPMYGIKESLNVAVAGGIILYDIISKSKI